MAILFMLLAGGFISASNLFMRKTIDIGGSTKGFLIFQMTMAFVVAFLLNPVKTGDFSFNASIAFLCLSMFTLHVLLLALYQWRALVIHFPRPEEMISFISTEQMKSQWFTPIMFFSSMIAQIGFFSFSERRRPQRQEVHYGVLGGV